jgi:hypothetical protein
MRPALVHHPGSAAEALTSTVSITQLCAEDRVRLPDLNPAASNLRRTFVGRNQIWAERQFALADLQRAATFLIAPGNDVIRTNDVDAARNVRDRALAEFDAQIKDFQVELAGLVPPKFADQMVNAFDMPEHERDMLVSTSNAVFAAVAAGRADDARTAMVAMDQRLFELTAVFSECNRIFHEIQRSEFAAQTAYARSVERDKYVFSGFVILVMSGAILYGARLRRQIRAAETSP